MPQCLGWNGPALVTTDTGPVADNELLLAAAQIAPHSNIAPKPSRIDRMNFLLAMLFHGPWNGCHVHIVREKTFSFCADRPGRLFDAGQVTQRFRCRRDGRTSQIPLRESCLKCAKDFARKPWKELCCEQAVCVGSVAAAPRNLAWLQPQLRRAEANSSPLANTGSPDPTIGPSMLDGCRPNK